MSGEIVIMQPRTQAEGPRPARKMRPRASDKNMDAAVAIMAGLALAEFVIGLGLLAWWKL